MSHFVVSSVAPPPVGSHSIVFPSSAAAISSAVIFLSAAIFITVDWPPESRVISNVAPVLPSPAAVTVAPAKSILNVPLVTAVPSVTPAEVLVFKSVFVGAAPAVAPAATYVNFTSISGSTTSVASVGSFVCLNVTLLPSASTVKSANVTLALPLTGSVTFAPPVLSAVATASAILSALVKSTPLVPCSNSIEVPPNSTVNLSPAAASLEA